MIAGQLTIKELLSAAANKGSKSGFRANESHVGDSTEERCVAVVTDLCGGRIGDQGLRLSEDSGGGVSRQVVCRYSEAECSGYRRDDETGSGHAERAVRLG